MKISFCSSFTVVLLLHAVWFLLLQNNIVEAQNATTTATTDPDEAAALNTIFGRWGISAPEQWNISGEICSGAALGATPHIDDESYTTLIKCVCTYNNNTICHITELRVNTLDITGEIPDEIWTLGYLFNLNLGKNLLSGRIPETISNLTRMQWLNFGVNMLSGELPAALGQLTELRSIGLGTNFFNGSLPSELGNCRKLQKIYLESAGVSGEIPASFANLRQLTTFWAIDNNLTGNIPEFIGNWTQLQSLRFEGNSFTGPIPESFANLTALTELRISDLTNSSSSLAFIRDMKGLATLSLRNNNLTGSIPSNIGDFGNLTLLDLSFNNFTGEVPEAVFNLGQLSFLFLGNNRFTGSIPAQKSATLRNIDVSFNNLTGSIPSWVNADNLQLNLVGNNLTIDNTNSRFLPSGLTCLQRGFPCNRGAPRYSQFAIKCGGPQITSSQNILYESDNETLGPATYYVTSSQRWAVSNVGYPAGTTSPQYKLSSSNDVSNTVDPEIFQTCRLSASSLRYYGLGLENGNYTVNLQFAEIVIQGVNRWWSLGRRAFDVYIQGNRVLQDFDIRRTADGQSNRVVQRNYTVNVSENYLEIHLFWNGRGTCCIPTEGTYGPSISAISATPNFIPTVSNRDPSRKKDHTGMIAGIVVSVGIICLAAFAVLFFIVQKRRRQRALEDEEFLGIDTKPYTFHYSELKAATDDFNAENKLGEGGFGPVYKGKLSDGRVVAVKQLSVQSHQGKSQFVAEIATISAVQHRNLVKLYGCCINENHNRLLVYEYLENRSLDHALFGEKSLNLDWPTRFEICMGVARGLTYLHEESRLRIVHRDVKASNILLDSQLVPKISDFGLAKLYDDDKTHISTRVAGTIGYLAPEYALRGHLTEKADVFAFGVVALEIISGRPNSYANMDEDQIYLLEWAWTLHENNREVELLDPKVTEFDEEELIRMMRVALLCTQTSPMLRPSMSRVVGMLSGDLEVSTVISRPGYLTDWKFQDISGFMTDNPTIGTDSTNTTNYSSSVHTHTMHSQSNTEPVLHETDDEDDK